jgi:hypothetical protein
MYIVLHVPIHINLVVRIIKEKCKGGAATTSSLFFYILVLLNCFIFVIEVVKVREHKLLFDAAMLLLLFMERCIILAEKDFLIVAAVFVACQGNQKRSGWQ